MKPAIKLILFVLFVFVSVFLSLSSGDSGISLFSFVHALSDNGVDRVILLDLRIPRVLLGFFVGGALGVSGVMLQALFRNPLTEPYTLGVSGGAAFGAALAIVFGLGRFMAFGGFVGSLAVVFFIYLLSVKNRVVDISKMLLIGVMVSFVSSSLVLFLMAISNPAKLHRIVFWMMGSLQWPNSFAVVLNVISAVFVLIVGIFLSWNLNAISVSEEDAVYLGVNVEFTKKAVFFVSSLAVGIAVAFAGIIGFVGLVVPHFFRLTFSRDHKFLIPLSFFGGGSFLILSDALARSLIAPIELPVGVITGIVGGVVFIWVLAKSRWMFNA
ncbi:FecCD family ABC transporter permease [Hippea alviniae]|uniref:FecCD family ABC transporter permease n=1 Tax=Hippea alviniae TaxID=1279027 RepID=UPI0003B5DC53|nr:iron ABC transporter permease [Hippea alviniae]